MASTGWQSSDLLARFNALAGRPSSDDITAAEKYGVLSDAQDAVIQRIVGVTRQATPTTAPTAMTTADGGYTYTFGLDGNGYALYPLNARIFPTQSAVPDYPWTPGVDYLDEGSVIRLPNNTPWAGPLYWYGVTPPAQMSASVQPVLMPPPARILIVIDAVRSFAEQYLRNAALADQMEIKWDREYGAQMVTIRKHLRGNGNVSRLGYPFGVGGMNLGSSF